MIGLEEFHPPALVVMYIYIYTHMYMYTYTSKRIHTLSVCLLVHRGVRRSERERDWP